MLTQVSFWNLFNTDLQRFYIVSVPACALGPVEETSVDIGRSSIMAWIDSPKFSSVQVVLGLF